MEFLRLNENSKLQEQALIISAYAGLAHIGIVQDSLEVSEQYIELGQSYLKKLRESNSYMKMYAVSSQYYLKVNKFNRALKEANALLELSREINDIKFMQVAYEYKSRSHSALQQFDLAYQFQEESTVLKDSIFRTDQNQLVHEMEAKFLKKEQDLEIVQLKDKDLLSQERLSTQRKLITFGSLGLLLFSLFSFFLFRQRKKISQQNTVISSALADKELLLKEIHHRVKNNLQVVSSLLGLQSEYIKDESALSAINEGRNRVRSMSLIHQDLYSGDNLKGINMKSYFDKLISGLFDTYNINNESIKLGLSIQDLNLDVDTVVPLGLIANELVSNALKHGFKKKNEGLINVTLEERNNRLEMIVSDNGEGFDVDLINEEISSFGFQMIYAFKEKLNANLEITSNDITSIKLTIADYQKT